MHLAAALNIPVVALFGPTDPARNGPYSARAKVLRNRESVTSYSHVDRVDAGLTKITPEEVVAAAEVLLKPGSSD
jgi:heptosyltransferase-1